MPFSDPPVFGEDIKYFYNKLKNREVFSFSKFADGEWSIILGRSINNGEFRYNYNTDETYRNELIRAFRYKNDRYYVGISCPCCQGEHVFNEMRSFSGQSEDKLTWANLWVNSNYNYYTDNIVPLYSEYNTILVANKDSNFDSLPFTPDWIFKVSNNAWIENRDLISKLQDLSDQKEGALFLFCCGPFGNVLAHRLTEYNDKNTFLDIGSTLNPYLGTGFTRGYFSQHENMGDCVWELT